ncbi:MAG TPA: hypothetical protein VGV69_04065, partial [Solirubrobacterales bacterium]|nr:hypothetical protein [Solirubrobacterales bacterium]
MKPKLDVDETFREVFGIYREHVGVLLPVAFWLFLLLAVVEVLIGENLALAPLSILASVVAGTLYQGIV